MATFYFLPPLKPRKGQAWRVVEFIRISTPTQDIKSLDKQKALIATCGRRLQQGGASHG